MGLSHCPIQSPPADQMNAYQAQTAHDHRFITTHINKLMHKSGKFKAWGARDRWAFIKSEYEKKLREREMSGRVTARTSYSTLHQEREELKWLWSKWEFCLGGHDEGFEDLEGGGIDAPLEHAKVRHYQDEDEDDDEELPHLKPETTKLFMPGQDSIDATQTDVNAGGIASESTLVVTKVDDKKRALGLKEGMVVTRGFSLARLVAESNGLEYKAELIKGKVQRVWKVVEGRVVVWPPFSAAHTLETNIESETAMSKSKKRKLEDEREQSAIGHVET